MAVPPDSEQREVTEATIFMGRFVKFITRINDVVYRIQRHPRARMIVVHFDRLAPYLGAALDEQCFVVKQG
jgi:hypothetical protein